MNENFNIPDMLNVESADNFKCHPSGDGKLFNATNSESYFEALALLISENSFTQEGLNQALISACSQGHKLLVQKLVRAGANIEHQDDHGNTPLLICAENGFTDIVQFLVSRHANVNAVNYVGNTALILSVCPAGSTDLTRFLLEQQDVDIHHENQHGDTALNRATQFMDVDTLRLLLQKSMKRNNQEISRQGFMIKQEPQCTFFKSRSQETKREVTTTETGREAEHELLKKHIITGKSPIELAIRAGGAQSLGMLLDCQFSCKEEKNKYIDGALMYMFQESRHKSRERFSSIDVIIIRKLLQYGADVNQGLGSKLISKAVESGNFQLVKLLCIHGAEMKRYDSREQDPLVIAAKNGRRDLIELLLKYKAVVNEANFADSALDSALRNGHTKCAKLLIGRGAKMDVINALTSAVYHQVPSYMHFLFKNYNHEIMDYFSQQPLKARKLLTLAVEKGNCEIIGKILDAGISEMDTWKKTPVRASTSKNIEDSEFLVLGRADVNREMEDKHGTDTALSHDCTVEKGKLFVDYGASVSCKNEDKTPLMIVASRDNCVNMLQMLLDNGADVNKKDNKGDTALMYAVMTLNYKNLTCLIDSARNKNNLINIQNNQGLTPIILSVQLGSVAITRKLIENGADVNIRDIHENTALHHLLISPYYQINEILTSVLDAGSHINCQNSDGLSPLMLAAKWQNASVMSQLLDAGADVNDVSKRNNTSKTALSFVSDILYHGYSTIFCIETLLDRGGDSSYINHKCLHGLVIQKQINVILKLIKHGAGPVEVEANKIGMRIGSAGEPSTVSPRRVALSAGEPSTVSPLCVALSAGEPSTVSPLCVALLVGQVKLARYFVDIFFLTRSDLTMFRFSKDMTRRLQQEKQEDSLHFLQELSSSPLCLVKLCLVSVSATVGSSPERVARVDSLPLPQVMKDRLLFKTDNDEHLSF